MSSTDPMKGDFSIQSETTQRISHQLYRCHRKRSTRSSSLTKPTTQEMTYNYYFGHSSKSLRETVGLFSLATIRTKSLNPSIPDVLSLTFLFEEKRSNKSLLISSKDSTLSWSKKGLRLIRKY